MITYLNSIKDSKTQKCTAEIWERLIASPPNKQYIEMFRETGDVKWKQLLPAVNFHGYDPKVLTEDYGSRKQENLVPTGLFMLDIDHVENPMEIVAPLIHDPLAPQGGKNPLAPEGGTLNSSADKKTTDKTNNNLPQGGTFNSSADKKTTDKSNKDLPLGGIEGVAGVLAEVNPRSWTS